jgi:hypothetical protein
VAPNGDYRLLAQRGSLKDYFDEEAALLSRGICGEMLLQPNQLSTHSTEVIKQMVATLRTMGQCVNRACSGDDMPGNIARYESLRSDMSSLSGLGSFWQALLNISLNSIALLPLQQGLHQTAACCTDFADRLQRLTDTV